MYYIIKRNSGEAQFDASHVNIVLGNDIYDIVKSPMNTNLEKISDFVVDDNQVLVKSDLRIGRRVREKIESALDIKLSELMLG